MDRLLVIALLTVVQWANATTPTCDFHVTESIPEGLTFVSGPIFNSTFHELKEIVEEARDRLDIAAFYLTLMGTDVLPDPGESGREGEELLRSLIAAARRGVKTRIAVNDDKLSSPSDLEQLRVAGVEIRAVNFTRLQGAGILHTKFLVADGQNFYIGSANMDWRSLTQVKETGVTVRKCPVLAQDLLKIFEVYWILGESDSQIPDTWPPALNTDISLQNPLSVNMGGTQSDVFIASSPRVFNPIGRTNDIDALISVIDGAKNFIDIAVMDYFPKFLFTKTHAYWPVIDNALRRAANDRGVRVRLLASKWSHTRKELFAFLKSLNSLRELSYRGKIQVKVFVVPTIGPDQERIPFARVNHNKYMVTDESAYIGTSNWSADYFVNTAGVSLVSRESRTGRYRNDTLRESFVQLFDRDWYSAYAQELTN